jgi:tetraacyldisaccharide 4'-kinase
MQLIGDEAVNILDDTFRKPLADFAVQPFHAVAAIGNPERFFEHLRSKGLVFESHVFADHYDYTPDDLNFPGSRTVLMTEKDAVKCRRFATADFWYVPVRAELSKAFAEQIGLLLKEKCNG